MASLAFVRIDLFSNCVDTFFKELDANIPQNVLDNGKRGSLMQLAGIRSKISQWEKQRSQPYSFKALAMVQETTQLKKERVLMRTSASPGKRATKREVAPVPSVLFTATTPPGVCSSPLPGPKPKASPGLISSPKSSMIPSQPAFDSSPAAGPDLSALCSAVQALKKLPLPSAPTPMNYGPKTLNQQGSLMAAKTPNVTPAVAPRFASAVQNGSTAGMTPIRRTPRIVAAPRTPGAPPNTPASPRSRNSAMVALNLPLHASGIILPSSPVDPMTAVSKAATEYDGDDVVMGDVTPLRLEPEDDSRCPVHVPSVATGNQHSKAALEPTKLEDSTSHALHDNEELITDEVIVGLSARSVGKMDALVLQSGGTVEGKKGVAEMAQLEKPESPIMTNNPLATEEEKFTDLEGVSAIQQGANEAVAVSLHSPTPSSGCSGVSNNPLFVGDAAYPTPPSVSAPTRRLSGCPVRLPSPSTPLSTRSAASEGMKLAEQLHIVAEQLSTPACALDDVTFQFKGDVQALLQALDAATPRSSHVATPKYGAFSGKITRAMADASTEERPKQQARTRNSSLSNGSGAPILDLSAFTADGDLQTSPGKGTPYKMLAVSPVELQHIAATVSPAMEPNNFVFKITTESESNGEEVSVLMERIAGLEAECAEAADLLSGYQGTIAELQDQHSAALVRIKSEVGLLESEVDRLNQEKTRLSSQFESLYREKYMPLKAEASALRRGGELLRGKLTEVEGRASRAQELEEELGAARASVAAAKAEATAAREAERLAERKVTAVSTTLADAEKRWSTKFEAEMRRLEATLAAKDSEIQAWRDKHTALARQHDEAVHRAHLAQAARERKAAEVARKEEEICALEVRLNGFERVLSQYRAENEKFAATKERYKAAVAALEQEVAAKDAEKLTLTSMCNELLSRLEAV